MRVDFVLISEGPSDEGMLSHLENLCIEAGVDEVTGIPLDFRRLPNPIGRTVEEKPRVTLILEPGANLILIHRDADSRNAEPRYQEISTAVAQCKLTKQWAAIVPVQETEAWLLLDEAAIRSVVGKPNGRNALHLPTSHNVENVAQPKERLQRALTDAAQVTGRRLQQLNRDFSTHRRTLLLKLPIYGPIREVPSWRRMRDDIHSALHLLSQEEREL
jgi:Domain of unknown function (DUF4276)